MRAICCRALKIDETVSDAVDCDEQGAAMKNLDEAVVSRELRKPWNRHCEDALTEAPLLSKRTALASRLSHDFSVQSSWRLQSRVLRLRIELCVDMLMRPPDDQTR